MTRFFGTPIVVNRYLHGEQWALLGGTIYAAPGALRALLIGIFVSGWPYRDAAAQEEDG